MTPSSTPSSTAIEEVTPHQLKELMAQESPPILLDVRESAELSICAFPKFTHIPLSNLAREIDRLSQDQPIITICHHGIRSLQATLFLKSHGFQNVFNLKGGIHAWATQVDPGMNVY